MYRLSNEKINGPFVSSIQGCSREEQWPSLANGLQRLKRSSVWRCHLAGFQRRLSSLSYRFEKSRSSSVPLPKGHRADLLFEGVRLRWRYRQLVDEIHEQSWPYNNQEWRRKGMRILTSIADHLCNLTLWTWVWHFFSNIWITGSLSVMRLH